MEERRDLFTVSASISAAAWEELEAKLQRLQGKARTWGAELTYTVSDEYLYTQYLRHNGEYVARENCRTLHTVARDVTITGEMLSAWRDCEILAYIEHVDEGRNIVTAIGGAEINPAWYTIPGNCDHCNTSRARLATWILRNRETGALVQVGRACIKDYLGIDPSLPLAILALEKDITFDGAADYPDEHESFRAGAAAVNPIDAIAAACAAVEAYGYVKSSDLGSTKGETVKALLKDSHAVTVEAKHEERAKIIAAWMQSQDFDAMTDNLLHTCRIVIDSGVCKWRHLGYLAYLPVAYDKAMERGRAEDTSAAAVSQHIGREGERIEIKVTDCKLITSWPSDYGVTYLYKMHDERGNVLVWFASNPFQREIKGDFVEWAQGDYRKEQGKNGYYEMHQEQFEAGKIKATIKAHDERDGIKQTVLTRVKAI